MHCSRPFVIPTVPRAAYLGTEGVALFSLPFEARPVDPVRRELYRQLPTSSRSGWFAPETAAVRVEALPKGRQSPEGGVPPPKKRRGRRRARQ